MQVRAAAVPFNSRVRVCVELRIDAHDSAETDTVAAYHNAHAGTVVLRCTRRILHPEVALLLFCARRS